MEPIKFVIRCSVFVLIPLHLNAREDLGVAQLAMDRLTELTNYVQPRWFFFHDMVTLLPGKQLTSGQILGRVVNHSDTSSLTLGLIGGLWISYGVSGIVVFFLLCGRLISYWWNRYIMSGKWIHQALLVVGLDYLLELTNRGMFKPMYIIGPIIVMLIGSRKVKRTREKEAQVAS
ncbi:hypothetical protein, partial [Alicyclobacillus shizuokensis]|uniref:hypothetical protein n=1 Tax=Alicyclobacillus shizuokensis TaxID=392014 RepID=UPI000B043AC1